MNAGFLQLFRARLGDLRLHLPAGDRARSSRSRARNPDAALQRAVLQMVRGRSGRHAAASAISTLVAIISSAVSTVLGFLAPMVLPAMWCRAALLRALITLSVSYLIIGMGLLITFTRLASRNRFGGRPRPCGDQPAFMLCDHLQPDGRSPDQYRARGKRPWRQRCQVLTLITAPMLWPAMFASFFLSMTFSWDEFVIAFL